MTRLKAMRAIGATPSMPVNPAEYLTDWLIEIGPTIVGAMGSGPIGWADIAAWQAINGIEVEPWEGRILRQLSASYLDQCHLARKAACPPPYSDFEREPATVRDRVSKQFAAMFRALSGQA